MKAKAAKSGDTRQRILEAGLALFSKKGYLGAATKEIAAEAGVAEVTLFRHFPSKESLLEAVVGTYSFLPTLKGLMGEIEGLPYKEALSEIAGRFLNALSERKEMIVIMYSEIHRYPAKTRLIYHNFIDEMFTTLASYFSGLQDRGILRRFEPEAGARAFLGMFFSYFTAQEFKLRKRLGRKESEALHKEFIEIFMRGTLK
ncbi:MAG: TetR/AcrR family transcriptional regulator [Parvibaculum sp.]|uniref:TetR/AcrR family transcriptional regulator n=1 Tax=Parvibaculum sp. TaxID=2024848 RepID=UPI002730DE02|nr:TetR/AcrR family transcriptional regulator [Parvibaculum sp.]MDP2151615.1 TetR/AcrR family transcriptional regulator [Parvibaculum sp.]